LQDIAISRQRYPTRRRWTAGLVFRRHDHFGTSVRRPASRRAMPGVEPDPGRHDPARYPTRWRAHRGRPCRGLAPAAPARGARRLAGTAR